MQREGKAPLILVILAPAIGLRVASSRTAIEIGPKEKSSHELLPPPPDAGNDGACSWPAEHALRTVLAPSFNNPALTKKTRFLHARSVFPFVLMASRTRFDCARKCSTF